MIDSINGRLFIAYKSNADRLRVWDTGIIEHAINTTGLSEPAIQRIREAPFVTCDCKERPGVIYKPSGRTVCGGCGGLIEGPPPPPKERP